MKICKTALAYFVFVTMAFHGTVSSAREEAYSVAVLPCPVLNTPYFNSVFGGKDGKTVKVDQKGLIRALEFIALPGTPFEIISETKKTSHSILEVRTSDYPSTGPLFIDSRFVSFAQQKPAEREKPLFSKDRILSNMLSMKGWPYMWGGNLCSGIRQMTEFYPPAGKVSPETLSRWRLEGVDCSGLIYQASGGYTPRNTSTMLTFGRGLDIEGLSAEEIARKTQPLDLIVWQGHVVIVFGKDAAIESTHPKGVIVTDLVARLRSIMSEKTPVNSWNRSGGAIFVIRRWYP